MPVHRVQPPELDPLTAAIAQIEATGEEVVSVQSYAGEWVIVTRPAPAKPRTKTIQP